MEGQRVEHQEDQEKNVAVHERLREEIRRLKAEREGWGDEARALQGKLERA